MRTAEQILQSKGVQFPASRSPRDYNLVLLAMEEYAIQKLEKTVCEYEIDRVNLVAMTLERDEFDEANKKLGSQIRRIKFVLFAEDVSVLDKIQHIQKIFINDAKENN